MLKRPDLTGQEFGRLCVINYYGHDKHNRALWRCRCVCGKETIVAAPNLRNGYTKSCGCLFKEMNKGLTVTNGNQTRLYQIWSKMKDRCTNHNDAKYHCYGGRGITVCSNWMKYEPFYEWALSNDYAENLTIERKDNNGNYEPNNCRWATRKEQCRNKRNNKRIEFRGQTKTVIEWAEILNIKRYTLYSRFNNGWPIEKALTMPARKLTKS